MVHFTPGSRFFRSYQSHLSIGQSCCCSNLWNRGLAGGSFPGWIRNLFGIWNLPGSVGLGGFQKPFRNCKNFRNFNRGMEHGFARPRAGFDPSVVDPDGCFLNDPAKNQFRFHKWENRFSFHFTVWVVLFGRFFRIKFRILQTRGSRSLAI